jgi:HD-GYP domain-containing protein (c-di-GMP phosphodiesterase class II)
MAENISLTEEDLKVGEKVPWAIYSSDGRMLLNSGQQVSSEDKLKILLSLGACRKPDVEQAQVEEEAPGEGEAENLPILERLDDLASRVSDFLTELALGQGTDLSERLYTIVADTRRLTLEHSDLILGALLLNRKTAYSRVHPIMTAVVCQLLEDKIDADEGEMEALLCGAITANVGMLDLVDELAEQEGPLSDEQREIVVAHPLRCCELLETSGIDDPRILEVVQKHHEKLDGSGYPDGIRGKALTLMSSTLSLADVYTAMLLPRKYRPGIYGKHAIQRVFFQRGEKINSDLVIVFIKEVGLYPPGTFVKLANDEKAIVIRRGRMRADKPVVMALYNPRGDVHKAPKRRHTNSIDYAIVENLCPPDEFPFDTLTIWQGEKARFRARLGTS